MKKWMTLLLAAVMLLGLAACGAGASGRPEDNDPVGNLLHFEVTKSVYENEYKADDGTLLLSECYELPRLELRTEDGTLYAAAENVTSNAAPNDAVAAQVTVQSLFNNEMDNVRAGLRSEAEQMAAEAKKLYLADETAVFAMGGYWSNQIAVKTICQADGGLLSIAAQGDSYYGGVHPNGYSRAWNFDLTKGEFLTIDALSSEAGDLNGHSVQQLICFEMNRQIYEKSLNEGYFDDYGSYLSDFPSFASFYFTPSGMTVVFDIYIIAPYAAGSQEFEVPYSAFYNALGEHAKEILDVSQEQLVLADFDAAATLWSWFYMDDPPMDYNVTAEVDGDLYDLADIKGVETLEDLRVLLLRYLTPELADEWLGSTEQRYRDIDGRLYALSAGRGGNESLGGYTCSVVIEGDSGVLTQTVALLAWDDTAQTWTDTGKTEAYEYPFTLVDGHAVFSAFPYPY